MGNEVALHLSGGVFFNLMLAARKKPVANQNQCLKELLYIYDRSAKEMAGNSLVTIASRFRNCDPDLHSDYIRFGDPVVVEEFNGRMRENYASVVGEVKNYADQYLDLEVNGKWLVRALMELVEKDNLIQDNAKFMAIPGGLPAYKQEFPEMHVVYIYNLLLSVWHYICCTHGMTENGQETYFALADFAGESRPRKFDRSRIGFESHEDVMVSYDMEIVQDDMKIPEPAAAYVRKLAGKPDRQLEIFAPVNSAVPKEVESIFSFVVEHTHTSDRKAALNRYQTYLNRAREKHSKKKTFLYEMQRDFYGFFVCNDVKRRETVYRGEHRNDKKDDRVIKNACIDSFEEERRFIVLSGTGGMGKSMMMTHFMLDTIDKNKETGKVPVFVLLRDYNPAAGDLIDFIFGELKRHDMDLHLSDLVELLQSGKGVILFDGLDEIKSENCRRFYKEMENLADSYPEASYIVSSRPTMNFRGLSRFTVYDLQPFSQEQAVEMVGKLDQSVVDPVIQKDFIQDLKCNRFGFDWRERMDFLGNPLFLTILLLAYEGNHDIPTERYLFYEQAYDAMAKKHDAAKALTREFATGLNSREFQNYFGEFCTITYEQEKYDFTPEEISSYFQEVIEANELDTTPEAFIEDVTGKICLIYKDGGKYYFIHRSFQEYFVAYFFSRQLEQRYGAVLDIFQRRDSADHDSVVLPMLFDMEQNKTELCIIIPFLEQIFKDENDDEAYEHFLEYFYPIICYEQGDVTEFSMGTSESSIYEFIADKYNFKEMIDGDELPEMDYWVDREYVYYDRNWDKDTDDIGTQLIARIDLPEGYERSYMEWTGEEMEVVGKSYEIRVMDVYRRSIYEDTLEMLTNDTFPLKKEFYSAKELYMKLKDKYKKKKDRKSFRSRFH
ncbi:NACHT domain-containing protein [Blautia sp.]